MSMFPPVHKNKNILEDLTNVHITFNKWKGKEMEREKWKGSAYFWRFYNKALFLFHQTTSIASIS